MKRVKKFFKWFVALSLLVVSMLIGAGVLFEKQIIRQLLNQLNAQLKQPLFIKHASLSLLRDFPNASVSLHNVILKDASNSQLLQAESIRFSFGLVDLLRKEVVFRRVRINDGSLHLVIDKNGMPNYDVLKETTKEGSVPDVDTFNSSIVLEEALLTDMYINYSNDKLSQNFSQFVKKAVFSGALSANAFSLRSHANCFSDSIHLNENTFLKNMEWGYEAELHVDKTSKNLELKSVSLNIEDSRFSAIGTVRANSKGQLYDLKINSNNFELGTLLKATAASAIGKLSDLDCEGNIQLHASITGLYSKTTQPEVSATLELKNGEIHHPKLFFPILDASLLATFTNSATDATGPIVLEINQLKGYVDKNPITLFLRLENIKDPYIDFIADGELPLTQLEAIWPKESLQKTDGTLIFRTVKMSGLASQLADPAQWANVVLRGELESKGLKFEFKGHKFLINSGHFSLDDEAASLNDLQILIDNSDLTVNGQAHKLMPVILSYFSETLSDDTSIGFNVNVKSDYLDVKNLLDVIIAAGEQENIQEAQSVVKADAIEKIGKLLNGNISAKLSKFSYDKIDGETFNGTLTINNNDLEMAGSTKMMKGICNIETKIKLSNSPTLSAKILFENIDISTLFEQGNNLGQDYIKAENIGGNMNAGALIYGVWDSLLQFNTDQLHVLAGIKIDNGYLRNFELLESFSDYVEMDDLKNVKFATLHNWLEYRDNTFLLPAMFVQNNAMNLLVCGKQTIHGELEYNFQINAGQVLAKKLSYRKFKGNIIPAKKDGFFNLYVHMTGTTNDFQYEFSKKIVKHSLLKSEEDRKRIKQIMMDAFGTGIASFADKDETLRFDSNEDFSDQDGTEYIEGF